MRTAICRAESPSTVYFWLRKCLLLKRGVVETVDSILRCIEDIFKKSEGNLSTIGDVTRTGRHDLDLKKPSVMSKKIFSELKARKILLLQDKTFPSVVTSIIGEPINGSWWGHPMANPIYNGLNHCLHKNPILSVKLLSGKVSFISEALFPAFFSIVAKKRDWQIKKLNAEELKLYETIRKKGKLASDDKKLKETFKDLKKNLEKLEKRLLVFSEEEHTESGKHIKVFSPWSKCDLKVKSDVSYDDALEVFENLVDKYNVETGSKIKLPWQKSFIF